jgi:8-oxo-dGTP pyrophosphatase MutT (NUDIX family)
MSFEPEKFFVGLMDFFSILLPGALLTFLLMDLLDSIDAKNTVNTFQWSKAWLLAKSPKSLGVVQRFEADSKFFRCFVIVLLILMGVWSVQHRWHAIGMAIVFLPLAMWRYMEQRFKATNQAYWCVITQMAIGEQPREAKAGEPDTETKMGTYPTHAGGVVFRKRGRETEYLLVEARGKSSEWVLPKGHIEEGEQPCDTAVREVHEETGVLAKVRSELGSVSFTTSEAANTVQVFLMEYAGRGFRSDRDREHNWLPLNKAIEKVEYPETRKLLEEIRTMDPNNDKRGYTR